MQENNFDPDTGLLRPEYGHFSEMPTIPLNKKPNSSGSEIPFSSDAPTVPGQNPPASPESTPRPQTPKNGK